jgi:BRCA1-associated protein
MYVLKIEVKKEVAADSSATGPGGEQDAEVDEVQVSAGNPRVEHLTGIVHLYRQTKGRDEGEASAPAVPVNYKQESPVVLGTGEKHELALS